MDQYLANRLTNRGVFQVVTDPKKADAVFADRLGPALEARLDELFPLDPPVEAQSPDAVRPQPATKAGDEEAPVEPEPAPRAEVANVPPIRATTFSRTRGTVFLVDAQTRVVLWSVYEPPKNSSSEELDRTAVRIAERLRREAGSK
jgi:hypothetical protein